MLVLLALQALAQVAKIRPTYSVTKVQTRHVWNRHNLRFQIEEYT